MIFLHIGTHKTGSKSLQRFLYDHSSKLKSMGFRLYAGCHKNPTNHMELHLASLRAERDSFARHNEPALVADAAYFDRIARRVQSFLKTSTQPHTIFSNEDLSYLRFPDEFARLRDIFNVPSSEICVIVYVRNQADFLRSYTQQIRTRKGREPSRNPSSAFYVGEDTWLADYESLISSYRTHLGCKVVVIDYDAQIGGPGNIIPSFLEVLGLRPPDFEWKDYFLHRAGGQRNGLRQSQHDTAIDVPPLIPANLPPGSLVFVVGPRRSGTTLVNNILCADPTANPQIGEAQPLTQLLNAFAWSAENFERMTRHYLPTLQALEDFAAATSRGLVQSCWEAQGRPVNLVLKNPELGLHIDRLRRYFPAARFVVCVRDPRDQIASERDVIARRDTPGAAKRKFPAAALARKYTHALEPVLKAAESSPESFCFVRYEDLVSDPKRESARLGAFCGLNLDAFDPGADWQRMAVSLGTLAQRPTYSPLYGRPVSAVRVGRFRDRLSAPDIQKIEQITSDVMRRFGYPATGSAPAMKAALARTAPVPNLEYVMIAEAGILERQALLLVESIRLLPGDAGTAGVTVVSPRPDRRPTQATLRQLERLGAEYLPLAIDSPCPYYGTSFKLGAMAAVEKRPGPSTLIMLDSDTLFLAPPVFDLGERCAALRPVDGKGMCTAGPDDPFDEYWRRLCALCDVSYDDIPWVEAAKDGLRVKACHNGGLVAANRRDGLFATSYEFLGRSVAVGLSPRPDSAQTATFRTGSGRVSGQTRQIWGAAQAVLSLALVSQGLEARILPPTYNVPINHFELLVRRFPEVASASVHVHYHWFCDADKLASNPLLDGRVTVPSSVRELLNRHVPLDQPPSVGRRLKRFLAVRLQDWRASATWLPG